MQRRPPIFESYNDEPPSAHALRPVSWAAVFGLIASLLVCVPVLAGAAGVVLGAVGLYQVRRQQAVGRVAAILAISLGILNLILWGGIMVVVSMVAVHVTSMEDTSEAFLAALANEDLKSARALAGSEISEEQLQVWSSQVLPPETTIRLPELSLQEPRELSLAWLTEGPWVMGGRVEYQPSGGQAPPPARQVRVTVVRRGGTYQVVDFSTPDPATPATQPSPSRPADG